MRFESQLESHRTQIKELKLEDPERERCKPEGGSRDNPDPGGVSPSSKESVLRVPLHH